MGKIQKENDEGKKKREMEKNEERERRAKEQLQIKKGYYPEGSIMMCFCVLFCQAGVLDTYTHKSTHTLETAVFVVLGGTKGLK